MTNSSDLDLLCWTPYIGDSSDLRAAAEEIAKSESAGAYLDLLVMDGSRSLHDWARSTSTDYQAVLFASDLTGPADLIGAFEAARASLWEDCTSRARQVWLLVSATILQPRLMETATLFRPEKFRLGATRSFVTVAETYAMLHGWEGRLVTRAGLEATELHLGLTSGDLTNGYERAMAIRMAIEDGASGASYLAEHMELGFLVAAALRDLIGERVAWMQRHAGVRPEVLQHHLLLLFGAAPSQLPEVTLRHSPTEDMLVAFAAEDGVVAELISRADCDWFIRYAAAANERISASTLHSLVFPPGTVDKWDHRNIVLWALRHPNMSRSTAEAVLADKSHRLMDYAAARTARDRAVEIRERETECLDR